MPVEFIKNLNEDTFLILWDITESESEMKIMLHDRLQDWGATEQHYENKHWLASRLAVLFHFRNEEVDLIKDAFNKPELMVDGVRHYISITHSFSKAAVLVSASRKVALDLELIDQRVERVMYKFCNEDELSYLTLSKDKTETLTTIWSAKETLYKWYGLKELDFRKNLFISPLQHDKKITKVNGKISKNNKEVTCGIIVERLGKYILTYIA